MVAVGRKVRQNVEHERIQENHLNQLTSLFGDLGCGVVGPVIGLVM
jgi:hypothetical protein